MEISVERRNKSQCNPYFANESYFSGLKTVHYLCLTSEYSGSAVHAIKREFRWENHWRQKPKTAMAQLALKELLATFYQAAVMFHFTDLFLTDSQAFATKPTVTSKKKNES